MVINKSNITKQMVSIIITMIFCFSLSSCSQNNSDVNSKQVAFDINRKKLNFSLFGRTQIIIHAVNKQLIYI